MKKIGAITIGQSPRVDVTSDIMGILGDIELIEAGALDGLTKDDIAKFKPEEGDYVLISRLNDGSSVVFAERYILPRLQDCINRLEAEGASLIMFFCTGDFPDNFTSNVPLIFPCKLLNGLVPALTTSSEIAVITPTPEQVPQCLDKWEKYVKTAHAVPASPYGEPAELERAAEEISKMANVDLVVMDCIGYSAAMKHKVAEITGKNIVLSRTLLAHVAAELIN